MNLIPATKADRVIEIISQHLGVESSTIEPAKLLVQCHDWVDDLDHLEIIMDIEDAFAIEVEDRDWEKEPIQALIDYVEQRAK